MQGDFEANSTHIVHVLCSTCNHIIFPKGISVKTLYKNHNGVFLKKSQQVKWNDNEHYELSCPAYGTFSKMALIEKQTKKEFPAELFYKLTEEQTKALKVKCPTCFPFVKK
jgi:hypothetical protein